MKTRIVKRTNPDGEHFVIQQLRWFRWKDASEEMKKLNYAKSQIWRFDGSQDKQEVVK